MVISFITKFLFGERYVMIQTELDVFKTLMPQPDVLLLIAGATSNAMHTSSQI